MKDIVIFVNAIRPATFSALQWHEKLTGESFTPIVLVDENIQASIEERNAQLGHRNAVIRISADFNSASSVMKALAPYRDRIFAVTSQYENSILELQKLIPYVPYLSLPTEKSLVWSTEKKEMRQMLEAYDPSLVPAYMEVFDHSDRTISSIEQAMSYPVVIKPSGLEGSLLVSLATNASELKSGIQRTFKGAQAAYSKWIKRQKPAILIEGFMDGEMYSIDTYVSSTGECRHTPPIRIITGRDIGYDDFFGYKQFTPTDLSSSEITAANTAAEQACRALGLRAVTAHIELIKTATGWKIIELGPRTGGYRHEIYSLSYGINHIMNDILNRGGREPVISRRPVAHTAFMNIYAKTEGMLSSIAGLEDVKALSSFVSLKQLYEIGDNVAFAKNNGDPVFNMLVSHNDKRQFEADIQAIEALVKLEVDGLGQQYAASASQHGNGINRDNTI